MPTALHERVGVVAALLAFSVAFLWPFEQLLYGDLVGALGVIPPLAVEVTALVIGPVLAVVYGCRYAALERTTGDRLPAMASRVVVGALVGAPLGALTGWVGSRAYVFGGAETFTSHAAVSLLVEPLLILPVVTAVTVGIVGGVATRLVLESSTESTTNSPLDSGGQRETHSRSRLGALAGLFGFFGGFAVSMGKFGVWFASEWVVLGGIQYAFIASVAVPLAAAGVTAAVTSPPTSRRHVRVVVGSALVGTSLGAVAAYAYTLAVQGDIVNRFLPTVFWSVVVDEVTVGFVVAFAAIAGSALSASVGRNTTD